MPSGAKKRKAAKRRKEQEEQQQQLGAHPPGSPNSPTTGPSSPPQGNGLSEEDDLMSHDGKGSESGSDIASPTAQGNHRHHLEIGEEEQADARVEPTSEDNRKESDPSGSADIKLMDSTVNGGEENRTESSAPQEMEKTAKETGEEVAVAAVDVREDEIAPLSPSKPVLHTSMEVPISEPEAVSVEDLRSGKDKDISVSGEVPSPMELKQSEALDTANLVEQPVHIPISEEVVQATDVPVESLEFVDNMAVAPSKKNVEKLVSLTDATKEELDPTVESHPGTGSYETTGSSEVVLSAHLNQRSSWLSCCGLFDVIASANR